MHYQNDLSHSFTRIILSCLLVIILMSGVAMAGFESEVKEISDVLLGTPFHAAIACAFGYMAIPSMKRNEWGAVLSMAGIAVCCDLVVIQLLKGSFANWILGK